MKKCNSCGIVKPLEEFYKNKFLTDGYENKCKRCRCDKINAQKQARRDVLRKRTKVTLPVSKICSKCEVDKPAEEYHKDITSPTGLRSLCKECANKRRIEYRRTPAGKIVAQRTLSKRRVSIMVGGEYTTEEWIERVEQYNYCCAYCHQKFPIDKLTVEHMQPVSKGGSNTIDNIVPACKSCNSRKHSNTPLDMLRKGMM